MDEKSLKILFDTYWGSQGWKNKRYTPPKDFEYAKEQGTMFDPITMSHDEVVDKIQKLTSSPALKGGDSHDGK